MKKNIDLKTFTEEIGETKLVTQTITPFSSEDELQDVINLKGISVTFNEGTDKEYKLFENFNFDIPDFPGEGQFISIMGQSGCGKSQILKLISGLNKPTSGEVLIYGKPLDGFIPMVFQQYSSFPWMTVLDNVALPLKLKGIKGEELKSTAMGFLRVVGLEDHAHKWARQPELSGGQLQRVSLARSMAGNKQILLLDEATGALDIKMKREVQDTLLKIYYESTFDPTIISVTHSIEEAVYLSNRIIVLKANPCSIYKIIDIKFPGQRTPGIRESSKFIEYTRELENIMNEVCK